MTTVDKSEAAALLAAAGASEQRSSALYGYRFNAPLLMLWGAIWMVVDLTIAFAPSPFVHHWGWNIGAGFGAIVSSLYNWSYSRRHAPRDRENPRSRAFFWRLMATWAFSACFVVAIMFIFAPFSWRDVHTFWGLFVAMIYACYGVWNGWRMTLIGVALGPATLYAHFGLSDHDYSIFMGAACGGGMLLAGLWLRRA